MSERKYALTVWGLWRWDGLPREGLELNGEDVDDWNYWELWEGMFETRTAALKAAMEMEDPA